MGQVDDELVGAWEIDPAHTRIGFSARHAMVTKVRGAFNEVDGRLHVDPAGAAHSSATLRLRAASVDTRHAQRDAHLRSADFFDAERYPDIVFRSTMIDEVEPRMYMVVGTLTIRDVTREIAIPIELRGVERGPDGELRAGFEGTRRVDRREFGLEWQVALDAGAVLVSERVTMEFEISAVRLPALPDGTPGADTDAGKGTGTGTHAGTAPGTGADDGSGAHAATRVDEGSGAHAGTRVQQHGQGAVQQRVPGAVEQRAAGAGDQRPASTQAPAPSQRTGGRHRAAPSGWLARIRGGRR